MELIERGEYAAYVKRRNALRSSSLITVKQLEEIFNDYMSHFDKINRCGGVEFVGNITIGTPEQQFAVAIDTASASLWVPGSVCDESCRSKRRFNPAISSTFTNRNGTWTLEYEVGEAFGVFGTDTIKASNMFGGLNEQQLSVPNTTIGLAQHVSPELEAESIDGVLGLAFTVLSGGNIVPPLINAINQSLLDEPLFTVWMQHRGKPVTTSSGLVTYGALDNTNCGPVVSYEPLTSETFYNFKDCCLHIDIFRTRILCRRNENFQMSAIGIGNYTHTKNYEATTDTGSPFMGGPKTVIDQLANAGGANYNATEGLYLVECNATISTLDVTIGVNKYPIDSVNYVNKIRENICYFAFFSYESGGFRPDWILGTPFIRQFCNIFDIGQKRMGFAPSL